MNVVTFCTLRCGQVRVLDCPGLAERMQAMLAATAIALHPEARCHCGGVLDTVVLPANVEVRA